MNEYDRHGTLVVRVGTRRSWSSPSARERTIESLSAETRRALREYLERDEERDEETHESVAQ